MLRQSLLKITATLLPLLFAAGLATAQDSTTAPLTDTSAPAPAPSAPAGGDNFKSLDEEVQALKKEVLDLNRELFVLEEELLFPANTQVAVFVSMDVGEFFALDSVTLKLDNKEVANYLYTEREAQALLRGGVHRVFIGNLKAGEHELIALFTGQGPNQRDYRRGATIKLEKGVGAKYVELKISDKAVKAQPEFIVKEWE
ncbi:AraC family transcriptional regulator [Peristeroidobacter agariperforans]|uniref:AraC family transcriptional regulator n=1 Tax=Peristeroidobacter agariperforans TaxID=268404 RepID=UPI0018E549DB|nr:AraC family transcriptional regulator [Peristeroidobacter agariperforans]